MRVAICLLFVALEIALAVCAVIAGRSRKAIGPSVALLVWALIPPMLGNMIIIAATGKTLATVGCYIYFLGMDLVMFALVRFMFEYCQITPKRKKLGLLANIPLLLDAIQLLCNLRFGHAFDSESIMMYGAPYFRLVPFAGQTVHRVVDYSILAAVLVVFIVKMISSPRINAERYTVILATMVFTTLWESFYIFSRTPIDRSMIGFGVFGLLVYYFSLHYRPLRLLDQMLAAIASELPEALFFFDAGGRCIWANPPGVALAGIQGDEFESASEKLRSLFGSFQEEGAVQREVTDGKTVRSYVLERRGVTDQKNRMAGFFLSVRDNTDEQRILRRETYKATHDSLTKVYNRAGYELLLAGTELENACLLLLDADDFKSVNDTHGHETGDRILQKIAGSIQAHFRPEDSVCRTGGDEFVVLMKHPKGMTAQQIGERIDRINDDLADTGDGLPPISVSVGVASGADAEDAAELFRRADRALYETKRRGRRGYTFYAAAGSEPLESPCFS